VNGQVLSHREGDSTEHSRNEEPFYKDRVKQRQKGKKGMNKDRKETKKGR